MDTLTQPRVVMAGRYLPSAQVAVVEVDPHFGTVEEWRQLMADVVEYTPEPSFADTYGVLYADEPAIEDDYAWIRQGC